VDMSRRCVRRFSDQRLTLWKFDTAIWLVLRNPWWFDDNRPDTKLSKSRLAIVPGHSHYNFLTSAEVPRIVAKFLADPMAAGQEEHTT
jgi:hypothetical protein